jgi:dipeptidyl aminopeptidase/acylaminoacyl peptidase
MTTGRAAEVERICEAALERSPIERAAYLAEACRDDSGLRREVETLLAHASAAEHFIETPALDVAAHRLARRLEVAIGTEIGPYTVTGHLGAGAMGDVYRARDSRLGRDVAVKLIPSVFVNDPERLARFEQESRAAAALNHPNILAVFDVGSHDGLPYVVSELLDGETLADRLASGSPMPVRRALDYATQIARGLAAAHEKGIVHRDLKPANVFVTADGQVKILDFGLAKLVEPDWAAARATLIPTAAPATAPGVVLGTVGYMSPEQARGQSADHRSDIFAFGALLYELLAGRRAFSGETTLDTLTAIVQDDPPDLPLAERHIPPLLGRIVDRCLEKNPVARFQSATDLAFALDALSRTSSSSEGTIDAVAAPDRSAGRRWPWVAASLIAGAAVTAAAAALYSRAPDLNQVRFAFTTPQLPLDRPAAMLAISPDGRRIAFVAQSSPSASSPSLFLRSMDAIEPQLVIGTEGAGLPFWSPDGRQIGFFADGKLKRVDASGGAPQIICDAPTGGGGTWNSSGTIVFSAGRDGLKRVAASGGEPSIVTNTKPDERYHFYVFPSFLPDGRHVLVTSATNAGLTDGDLRVISLDGKDQTVVLRTPTNALYAPPGYLIFHRGGTLVAQPFDAQQLSLSGEPVRIVESVESSGNILGAFSVSNNGVLVYQPRTGEGRSQLGWYDRAGKLLGRSGPVGDYHGIALSPDNKRIAVHQHQQPAAGGIWVLDFDRSSFTRLTTSPSHHVSPMWSPDGTLIAFASNRDGVFNIFQKSSSGAGDDEPIIKSAEDKYPEDWSADGSILYGQFSVQQSVTILLPLTADRKPRIVSDPNALQVLSKFSPNGRWIAFLSTDTGQEEVFVHSYPQRSSRVQISIQGGNYPRWSKRSQELFYMALDGTLMAVDVREEGTELRAGVPHALFKTAAVSTGEIGATYPYDVSSDAQRFIVNEVIGAASPAASLTVVLNWQSALGAREKR